MARLLIAAWMPLAFDEAYYWRWSKHLAPGYYDHPPLVALLIAAGTALAGDTPFGIRWPFVLLTIPATWALWRAAAILFEWAPIGRLTALYFNLTLLAILGTTLALPDAPLVASACFTLFFVAKLIETGRGAWWLGVGVSIGIGMLSKYTAVFLGGAVAIWVISLQSTRSWLRTPWPYAAILIALLLFAPVVLWNASHDWASFSRQGRRLVHSSWTLRYVGEYFASQIGLVTPAIFVLGCMGLFALCLARMGALPTRVLVCAMTLPVWFAFLIQSLQSRVEGNWTAPMFPALALAAAAAVCTTGWKHWSLRLVSLCYWSAAPISLGLAAAVVLQAGLGLIPLGYVDPTARQLGVGWPALAREIDAIRARVGAQAVMTTSYAVTGWLSYYSPPHATVFQFDERIRWVQEPPIDRSQLERPLLYVCRAPCGKLPIVVASFRSVNELEVKPRTRNGLMIDRYAIYRVSDPIWNTGRGTALSARADSPVQE